MDNNITICPKCGDYNDECMICINCGTRKIKTEYKVSEKDEIINFCDCLFDNSTNEFHPNLESFYNELRNKYVFSSPLFDQEEYNKFIRISKVYLRVGVPVEDLQLYEDYSAKQETSRRQRGIGVVTNDVVKCPKCGSTQIQLIKRRWSPLTGILTNKVDRVCMKCKKKF